MLKSTILLFALVLSASAIFLPRYYGRGGNKPPRTPPPAHTTPTKTSTASTTTTVATTTSTRTTTAPRTTTTLAPSSTTLSQRNATCDDGWHLFNRPKGPWCMKVDENGRSHQDAVKRCSAMGAVLTGFNNPVERMWITDEAYRLVPWDPIHAIWIGLVKSLSAGTFQWTDGNTDGPIPVVISEPDDRDETRGLRSCAHLMYVPFIHDTKHPWINRNTGDVGAYWCDRADILANTMFVCGKQGSR